MRILSMLERKKFLLIIECLLIEFLVIDGEIEMFGK